MKKIFKFATILAALSLLALSCNPDELSTEQFETNAVVLQAYGPQPVVRGGQLRFIGSNLQNVVSVTIPADNVITEIEVVASGVHSEIRVTVPKETSEPGFPVLTLKDGTTITGKTALTYSEPISIDELTPAEILPGGELTIKGDYLNLIHEVIFADKVKISEDAFTAHNRYTIKVTVPETARTGKVGLGTVDELKIAGAENEKDLLATLNIVESEAELVVKTAKGTLAADPIKAGAAATITGTNLKLVKSVKFDDATVTEFTTATDTQLSFALPATAKDGAVAIVMASGVEVAAGTLTTIVPTGLSAAPAPVKNGAALTVSGNDLDLVTAADFPNAEGAEFEFAAGKLTVTVPEKAQEDSLTLTQANGKSVKVAFSLVKPEFLAYSAGKVSAGGMLSIAGTNLDLVKSITFVSDGEDATAEFESGENFINLQVPMSAKTGKPTLNLKNGTTMEIPSINVVEAVFAYFKSIPEETVKAGEIFTATIANPDVLQYIEVNGEKIPHLLNGMTLYFVVPSGAKAKTNVRLISSNGDITYIIDFDPGDRIVTTIWHGYESVTWSAGAVTALSWGGYDWSAVKPGMILKATYTIDDEGGCIRFGNGSWVSLPSLAGLAPDGNLPLQEGGHEIVLTEEDITFMVDNGGLVVCGTGYTITYIDLIELIPQETAIWEGNSTVTWGGGAVTDLSWGGYDWSTVTPGTILCAHYTIDDEGGCIRFGNGSWNSIPSLAGLAADGNLPLQEGGHEVTLTAEDIDFLVANGGLVVCGTGYTITSIGLKK